MRDLWYRASDPIQLYFARRNWQPKDNPLVSIIIPTRDRWELLLARALKSVQKQTYMNWELIIIDDGSKRRGWDFGGANFSAIRTFRIEKDFHYPKIAWARWCAGPVRALNCGLTKVRGDYIFRMDDDDELFPDALELLVRAMQNTSVEYLSAQHLSDGNWVTPYVIRSRAVGGIQTTLMRSYLKCFRYNPDCWRKRWNCMNELDLQDRMIRAGVRTWYAPLIRVCKIDPRPGQDTVGWKAQLKEYGGQDDTIL